MDTYEIGRLLADARKVSGRTVQEVAERANVSASWLRYVEAGDYTRGGERRPMRAQPERLVRLCRVLGLDPAQFLADAGIIESAPDSVDLDAPLSAQLDTTGLDRDDLARAQAFIDGLRAGKA